MGVQNNIHLHFEVQTGDCCFAQVMSVDVVYPGEVRRITWLFILRFNLPAARFVGKKFIQ